MVQASWGIEQSRGIRNTTDPPTHILHSMLYTNHTSMWIKLCCHRIWRKKTYHVVCFINAGSLNISDAGLMLWHLIPEKEDVIEGHLKSLPLEIPNVIAHFYNSSSLRNNCEVFWTKSSWLKWDSSTNCDSCSGRRDELKLERWDK